jgi:hypothetical protein
MSAIIRNSYIIEFDQLVPLLLHLLQFILIDLHCKRVMESNKPTCFEPPSLASIDFVRVTLLFFSLRRQLQPRLRIGEHTAPLREKHAHRMIRHYARQFGQVSCERYREKKISIP